MRDKCDYKHAKPPEHLLKEAKQHTAAPATETADAQPESAEPTTTADDRTYSPAQRVFKRGGPSPSGYRACRLPCSSHSQGI